MGAIATAFSILPQLNSARKWAVDTLKNRGAVELPGSYPGEVWKRANAEQIAWLQDEWCYPALRGFRSRFRIQNESLFRQNEGDAPAPFVTEWVETEAYISNRGMLRLRYKSMDWPGDYIEFDAPNAAEWRENQRFAEDNGAVTAGRKRLVLSCKRCRLSEDGFTYACS